MIDLQQFGGISLVFGFMSVLIASFAITSELYQVKAATERLEIIGQNQRGWRASNLFWAVAAFVTGAGLLAISFYHRNNISIWLLLPGTVIYLSGATAWVMFAYRRAVNPTPYFTNDDFSPLVYIAVWGYLVGLFLYGIVFIQANYPIWLGLGTCSIAVLIATAALFRPDQFYPKFPPQLLYLPTLIAGVVIFLQ